MEVAEGPADEALRRPLGNCEASLRHRRRRQAAPGRCTARNQSSAARPPIDEADHPDPLLQRGADRSRTRSPTCRARSPASTSVEWLIIDDGSTDRTVEVARAHGVDHIVRLTNNKGLAAGFQAGLDAALKLGADVIVNTDADNQYYGRRHRQARRADRRRQRRHGRRRPPGRDDRALLAAEEGAAAARLVGRAPGVRDRRSPTRPPASAPTTARPRSQLQVVSKFTYTLETIIQAGKMLVAIDHVPIRTNAKTRESRLFPSMWRLRAPQRASRSSASTRMYEPLRVFMRRGAARSALAALVVWARFLVLLLERRRRAATSSR